MSRSNGAVATMHQHTMHVPLDGYDLLDVTHDLSLSWHEVYERRTQGCQAPTIIDFPNWDDVAGDLGLPEVKPEMPLTVATFILLPMRLAGYLAGDDVIKDALQDERETRRPFSKAR